MSAAHIIERPHRLLDAQIAHLDPQQRIAELEARVSFLQKHLDHQVVSIAELQADLRHRA